jgi:hypothetical protein
MEVANSLYDYTKRGPNESIAEQYITERLNQAAMASANVRPPIPNIGLTPPRFGYRSITPDIYDILDVDNTFSSSMTDWSGKVSGYQGTAFPSLNQL